MSSLTSLNAEKKKQQKNRFENSDKQIEQHFNSQTIERLIDCVPNW